MVATSIAYGLDTWPCHTHGCVRFANHQFSSSPRLSLLNTSSSGHVVEIQGFLIHGMTRERERERERVRQVESEDVTVFVTTV